MKARVQFNIYFNSVHFLNFTKFSFAFLRIFHILSIIVSNAAIDGFSLTNQLFELFRLLSIFIDPDIFNCGYFNVRTDSVDDYFGIKMYIPYIDFFFGAFTRRIFELSKYFIKFHLPLSYQIEKFQCRFLCYTFRTVFFNFARGFPSHLGGKVLTLA
jgi:hypothetical protein